MTITDITGTKHDVTGAKEINVIRTDAGYYVVSNSEMNMVVVGEQEWQKLLTILPNVIYLISRTDILSEIAKWAVSQHPYHCPPGLEQVLSILRDGYLKEVFPRYPYYKRCTEEEVRNIVQKCIFDQEICREWNKPRSGHDAQFVFTSRYDQPAPEDDIIDLYALCQNVVRGLCDHIIIKTSGESPEAL